MFVYFLYLFVSLFTFDILFFSNRFEAFEYDSRFFINPGSATGAFSPLWIPPIITSSVEIEPKGGEVDEKKVEELESEKSIPSLAPLAASITHPPTPTPSFALLDIQGTVVVSILFKSFQKCGEYVCLLN